jgi:hypothetical protein
VHFKQQPATRGARSPARMMGLVRSAHAIPDRRRR